MISVIKNVQQRIRVSTCIAQNEEHRTENLSFDFRAFLDSRYEHHYTPEEILGYIYAVLHAPTYRTRYAEFLRIDFPRVPFPESADDFETLSRLGWALIAGASACANCRGEFGRLSWQRRPHFEAVRYSPADQAISINKTQFFKPVPQAVWEFHIGGYQVLDKYLKSRKGTGSRSTKSTMSAPLPTVWRSPSSRWRRSTGLPARISRAGISPRRRYVRRWHCFAHDAHDSCSTSQAGELMAAADEPTFPRRKQPDLFGEDPVPPIGPTPTRCARGYTRSWPRRAQRNCPGSRRVRSTARSSRR